MKKCVGFDIGNHDIHIAVMKKGEIVRGITERLPEDIVKNGAITSFEAMTDFLKDIRKKYKLGVKNAGIVLPATLCYCRRFSVVAKTREQLIFNLPYGFQDFITDDKSNYFFDCAIIDAVQTGEGKPPELDVLAAAARKEVVSDYIDMFRKAGFHLKTIIPEELSLANILRCGEYNHSHGILDIGHNAVRLYLFVGSRFESVRIIDYGCNALDEVIAEHFGVDSKHLSATYRENNFEGVNGLEECRVIYRSIAFEVLKAVNFYRFNGGGSLAHLHCCGGGANNEELMKTLRDTLPVELTDMSEFFGEQKGKEKIDFQTVAVAAGVALQ